MLHVFACVFFIDPVVLLMLSMISVDTDLVLFPQLSRTPLKNISDSSRLLCLSGYSMHYSMYYNVCNSMSFIYVVGALVVY